MQSQMKTNRLPPEIKTSLSCSAAFCAPLPITKKGDSWEKKSQEDKTKFQTHNCCRKLVHEWMAITFNSTRVTCMANHGSLPKWSCHYIAYRYDRCVIETVELEELIKLTVLTASCILVANWWYQFCNTECVNLFIFSFESHEKNLRQQAKIIWSHTTLTTLLIY